ncbi:NADP-dependent oxidoreductase [Streptomyces olivaceiscleroticus]|uniref:NADP-dependent oxidoreductase n=1 Tax=Streptomyces olivaceiscleroticus TaxID=68245 RepID=A0ABN1B1X5_9ACTN
MTGRFVGHVWVSRTSVGAMTQRSEVPATHREVRLAARPRGAVTDDLFEIVEVPVPEPAPGRILVRTTTMGVAAVMRTLMDEQTAAGEVVAAPGADDLHPGDLVEHPLGWREFAVMDPSRARRLQPDLLSDPAAYLSQGPTALMGIGRGADVRPGDTVFVTGAAGGVGSLAGQLAKKRGAARVIGSKGGAGRGRRALRQRGRRAAPGRPGARRPGRARFAIIGAPATRMSGAASAVTENDTLSLLARGITLRGLALHDHLDLVAEWHREFGQGLRDGTLTFPHARFRGIEQAPRALRELTEGRHLGAVPVDL